MESMIQKTEKKLKISIAENILGWMDDEIALLQTQPSNLGRLNEFAVVFKAKNKKSAQENLDIIADQVKKNSPVKFKEIEYKGYKINYLHIPGIFKWLFGNLLSKLDKPYYTIVDRFVIFSNHPQTLKSIIDDIEAGKLLTKTDNINKFLNNFSGKSIVFMYMQTPVLFNNLKEFVSAQTWTDLQRNKKYFEYFPNIGFQVKNENDLLKIDLVAEFNPQFEEYTPIIYQFEPVILSFGDTLNQTSTVEEKTDEFEPIIVISDLDASKHEEFFDNGKLKLTVDLRNGMKQGAFKEYFENGELKLKGRYKNDLMDGTWKRYDEGGNLVESREYEEGKFREE